MKIEDIKNLVLQHCAKFEKLVEESILKLKIPKGDHSINDVRVGVQDALTAKNSNLEFHISEGKSEFRVMDKFNRAWIISNSLQELYNYQNGEITIRGLHYRMVARGMTNSDTHYARVKSAMVFARRNGQVAYEQFSDYERETLGHTAVDETTPERRVRISGNVIKHYLNNYNKNKWENQNVYPEIWIEKKALIGVFERICKENDVSLNPCKGYPSLTFLNDAAERFREQEDEGKRIVFCISVTMTPAARTYREVSKIAY